MDFGKEMDSHIWVLYSFQRYTILTQYTYIIISDKLRETMFIEISTEMSGTLSNTLNCLVQNEIVSWIYIASMRLIVSREMLYSKTVHQSMDNLRL